MIKIEVLKIEKIYEYLRNEDYELRKANGAFVFGRWDPRVASKSAEIYKRALLEYVLITGGIGKDSGFLTDLQIPEAKWQGALLNIVHGVPKENIYLEDKAANGAQCCEFGMQKIIDVNLPHEKLIMLVHPTSLRRTEALFNLKARNKNFQTKLQKVGTDYKFNPENPIDYKEAVAEILRLADWPAKGWCDAQADLPMDLVEYARHLDNLWKIK